jgi:flavodoxin
MNYPEKDRLTSGITDESEIYSILVGREAMKTLVVYDSLYGNTKAIAQAIGDALLGEVEMLHVGEANASALKACDLLVVGAPTHGAKPSPDMQAFLDQIGAAALEGINVAAFDTRMTVKLITMFGTAAPKIAKMLVEKGGTPMGKPTGFFVKGGEGPLKDGEIERAAAWAEGLLGS